MTAYVIGQANISDPERYDRYSAAAPASVAAYGGRFVVRGGELVVLEGDWQPNRLVITEFSDLETAKRWYHSPEYREVKRLRESAATLRIVAIDGYSA
jgi:uncharacterized protein (DUF1330 family)